MKTRTLRFQSRYPRISLLLAWTLMAASAVALEPQAVERLKRGCLFAYLPDESVFIPKIEFTPKWVPQPDALALGKQCASVTVRVTKTGSTVPLLESVLPVKKGVSDEARLTIPALHGNYEAHFVLAGLPEPITVTKPLARQLFAWEGNRLGITEEIYPPYEPVKVDGHSLSVVLRRYSMNGFGLFDKVLTEGRNILAGPITIRYTTAAGEGKWHKQTIRFDHQASAPQRALFSASAASDAVNLKTISTIEFDGCMKVEMELMPGRRPAEIRQLWIDIPLKNKEAPLFHEVSDYIRKNYSGFTPAGQGVVWDSSKSRRTAKWRNPFTSYIWLGAEERGLCWFAENDRNWITEKGENARPVQELIRIGDTLTLRIYLVNTPAIIREKHALVFGLQASPTKPMPARWAPK